MTLRLVRDTAKKPRVVHWWRYDGAYSVACGKQYSQGDVPLKSTVDIKCVTCKACLRIHARKNGGEFAAKPAIIRQIMDVVSPKKSA